MVYLCSARQIYNEIKSDINIAFIFSEKSHFFKIRIEILGNYTVARATVNGIRFYHTGMFTTLGQQRITLTGSGTPLVSGITSFTPQIIGPHPLGGQVCGFALSVN